MRLDNKPQGKAGLIPAKAFERERGYLSVLPAQLPATLSGPRARRRPVPGYVAFGANYYWVPGSQRADLKLLEYSDQLKLYLAGQCLAEYPLPAQGVRNQQFHPARPPGPASPRAQSQTSTGEGKTPARPGPGGQRAPEICPAQQRHPATQAIRQLRALSRQASIGLLRANPRTRPQIPHYRLAHHEAHRPVCLQRGAGQLPLPLVIEPRQRETYQQGLLTNLQPLPL